MSRKEVRGLGRVDIPGGLGSAPQPGFLSHPLRGWVGGMGRRMLVGRAKRAAERLPWWSSGYDSAPSAGGTGSNPGLGLRFCLPHTM